MINESTPELLAITLDVRGLTSGRHQRIEVPRASMVWAEQKNRGELLARYPVQDDLLMHSDFGLTRLELGFVALPDPDTGRYATLLVDPPPLPGEHDREAIAAALWAHYGDGPPTTPWEQVHPDHREGVYAAADAVLAVLRG